MELERRRASDSLVGNDVDGIESRHRVADPADLLAGGICSGHALIQALKGDLRLLTLLKSDLHVEIQLESLTITTIREERTRRRRPRGLSFFVSGTGEITRGKHPLEEKPFTDSERRPELLRYFTHP